MQKSLYRIYNIHIYLSSTAYNRFTGPNRGAKIYIIIYGGHARNIWTNESFRAGTSYTSVWNATTCYYHSYYYYYISVGGTIWYDETEGPKNGFPAADNEIHGRISYYSTHTNTARLYIYIVTLQISSTEL